MLPHRFIGLIAIAGMVAAAIVEAIMVWMLEPITDEAIVAHNLETVKWMPIAFIAVFIGRGLAGFAVEASLGYGSAAA